MQRIAALPNFRHSRPERSDGANARRRDATTGSVQPPNPSIAHKKCSNESKPSEPPHGRSHWFNDKFNKREPQCSALRLFQILGIRVLIAATVRQARDG